jgi:hypothetical protein
MLQIAEKIASPFPFVRVDLYSIKGKIYVSELNFTPEKGLLRITDENVDAQMGSWLSLEANETDDTQ